MIADALASCVEHSIDPSSIDIDFTMDPVSMVYVKYQPLDSVVSLDKASDDDLWYFGKMLLEMIDRHGVGMLRIHLKTARDLGLLPGVHEGRSDCSRRVTIEKAIGQILIFVYVGSQDIDKATAALSEARKLLNS